MALQLHFLQHSRQHYAEGAPLDRRVVDDFIVTSDTTAEFVIEISDHRGVSSDGGLQPHLCTFDDGLDALRKFISLGGLNCLGQVDEPDDLNRRLQRLGIRDASDKPLDIEQVPA